MAGWARGEGGGIVSTDPNGKGVPVDIVPLPDNLTDGACPCGARFAGHHRVDCARALAYEQSHVMENGVRYRAISWEYPARLDLTVRLTVSIDPLAYIARHRKQYDAHRPEYEDEKALDFIISEVEDSIGGAFIGLDERDGKRRIASTFVDFDGYGGCHSESFWCSVQEQLDADPESPSVVEEIPGQQSLLADEAAPSGSSTGALMAPDPGKSARWPKPDGGWYSYRITPAGWRRWWVNVLDHAGPRDLSSLAADWPRITLAFGEFGGWHWRGSRDRVQRRAERFIRRQLRRDEKRRALSIEVGDPAPSGRGDAS